MIYLKIRLETGAAAILTCRRGTEGQTIALVKILERVDDPS